MHPDVNRSPFPAEYLRADMAVFDTVYNPPQTLLLKQAAEAGAKTIEGVSMFVNQAAAQFEHFTGKTSDRSFIRKIVEKSLSL